MFRGIWGSVPEPGSSFVEVLTVHRLILIGALLALFLGLAGNARADDTAKAAQTRKKLKQKVTLDVKDERLEDVVDAIKDQVKGLSIRLDARGGVSKNRKLTYKAKDKPL